MYNKKLEKWLQPGGHIQDNELEHPMDTAIREVYEETGIKIKIIGQSYDGITIEPIAWPIIKKVGDMIDIQYLSCPITKELKNNEDNETCWFPIDKLEESNHIDPEIKQKVKQLYKKYKKN